MSATFDAETLTDYLNQIYQIEETLHNIHSQNDALTLPKLNECVNCLTLLTQISADLEKWIDEDAFIKLPKHILIGKLSYCIKMVSDCTIKSV